ncbi:MAG: nucleoside triphosphate pyrophosphohydrolase [Cycloclasticus sp. symbiont of Bathymodiolus heckerae]|nr:MAG: nucleoside triphosphate pyrophosphohydrolase [Cycloclasticus sp. symbiont of Bathymodiolus heckerae]
MPNRNNALKSEMDKLLTIMARLREPEKGCPWDLEQNFETIAPYTLEEAYEVVEAIQQKDMTALKDELGDLLFHVVFHARLAEEEKLFTFDDVVTGICDKLTRRHPHVFDGKTIAKEDLAKQWEEAKRKEKGAASQSILDQVSANQPAMSQAYKLQKKVASVGFDWQSLEPVIEKLDEEISELKDEIKLQENHQRVEEELGDVLFSCINLARHLDINPEWSLRQANKRFSGRFSYIEHALKQRGLSVEGSSLEDLGRLWEEAKRKRSTTET